MLFRYTININISEHNTFTFTDRCKCKSVKLGQKTYSKNNYNYGKAWMVFCNLPCVKFSTVSNYCVFLCFVFLTRFLSFLNSKLKLKVLFIMLDTLSLFLFAVIRARVKEIKTRNHDLSAIVEVKDVLKSSLVNIPRDTVTLYYNSACLCPQLVANEEYIIMGYENEERSR